MEAVIVIYLREIFYPDGFTFPLSEFGITISPLWRRLLLTEVGREAAALVLILSGCWLFGQNLRQRLAYFLVIFAVWDIFFYLWLKLLVNWPASLMDWDILFLIPVLWAGPVLAPLLISLTMLFFGMLILYQSGRARPLKATPAEWLGFCLAAVIVVVSFCIAGQYVTQSDFEAHFHWPLFALGQVSAVALFLKCLWNSK